MSQASDTLKHALLGSAIGSATAMVTNAAASTILKAVSSSLPTGPVGHAVAKGLINGSVAALCILVGDIIVTRTVGSDDPLFRLFYYQVAFHHAQPAWGFESAFRALLNQGWQSYSQNSHAKAPHKCDDCTKTGKSCGGCSGH